VQDLLSADHKTLGEKSAKKGEIRFSLTVIGLKGGVAYQLGVFIVKGMG
jgi:hypothetical protein